MTDAERLREEIRELYERHGRGDLPERTFQRSLERAVLDLYRAVVRAHLAPDEGIQCEHHVLHGHLKLAESALKEPDSQAVGLFATDRRLVRLRSLLKPALPITADDSDETRVDDVPYSAMMGLRTRRQVRMGEVLAGLVITGFALLFRSSLMVTGTLMAAVGILGVIHGLCLPSRWMEVQARDDLQGEPIRIHALRKRSARRLVKLVRGHLQGATSREARGDEGRALG